jgi:hypothetical protein
MILPRCISRFAIVTFFCLIVATVPADTPAAPPRVVENLSRNLKIRAISDPWTNETIVYDVNPDRTARNALWKFPKWLSRFEVSGDGNEIVAQNVDLLPLDFRSDDVLLTFIRRGTVIKEVTVNQLLGPHPDLVRTIGHFSWGNGLRGIDANGFALIDTVVGFFIFDAHGKCIFPPNNRVDSNDTR